MNLPSELDNNCSSFPFFSCGLQRGDPVLLRSRFRQPCPLKLTRHSLYGSKGTVEMQNAQPSDCRDELPQLRSHQRKLDEINV